MRTELTQTEILYNFNTDFDDLDNSYSFVLMTEHQKYVFQILLSYANSKISILLMRSNGQKMSVDHSVAPISTYLSSVEKSSPKELSNIISNLISGFGYSYNELHQYIRSNIDIFLIELLHDAESRGLIEIAISDDQYEQNAEILKLGLIASVLEKQGKISDANFLKAQVQNLLGKINKKNNNKFKQYLGNTDYETENNIFNHTRDLKKLRFG